MYRAFPSLCLCIFVVVFACPLVVVVVSGMVSLLAARRPVSSAASRYVTACSALGGVAKPTDEAAVVRQRLQRHAIAALLEDDELAAAVAHVKTRPEVRDRLDGAVQRMRATQAVVAPRQRCRHHSLAGVDDEDQCAINAAIRSVLGHAN